MNKKPQKKLSEMNSNELAIALCKLAEPASNLFGDQDVIDALRQLADAKETCGTVMQLMAKAVGIFAPVILGEKHRNDVFQIVAAVRGVDVEVICKQNGLQTVREIVQILFQDIDAIAFFRPYAHRKAVEGAGSSVQARKPSDCAGPDRSDALRDGTGCLENVHSGMLDGATEVME